MDSEIHFLRIVHWVQVFFLNKSLCKCWTKILMEKVVSDCVTFDVIYYRLLTFSSDANRIVYIKEFLGNISLVQWDLNHSAP